MARLLEVGPCGGARVRSLGGSRAGEVRLHRLLHNPRVTPAEMVATAAARTMGLVAGRHVLAIQDTTSLRDDGDQRSLHLHPVIALDAADGTLLGLLHAVLLRRTGGQRKQCNNRPFAGKESHRWLEAAERAAALAAAGGAARLTVIADREGDVYEMFALRPEGSDLLVRVQHDRPLRRQEEGGRDAAAEALTLHAALALAPELGQETLRLPAGPGRPAREATLTLRARAVTIRRPHRTLRAEAERLPAQVSLWAVEAREVEPPPGTTPAHWRLLTTHPVPTLAAARQVLGLYRRRWTIEELFRVMKTRGFAIEASRLAEGGPFENLATATLVAAVQVLQMVRERDGTAGRPARDLFDPAAHPALEALSRRLEGRTARQKNPHPKGSLAFAAWVCARLGGWTGYYGKPGPVVTLQGLIRFQAIQEGWNLRGVV